MALTDVGKEQVKLRATFINGLALIFFSIGVFAPLVSSVYVRQIAPDQAFLAAATAAICFVLTFALHVRATLHLTEMDK